VLLGLYIGYFGYPNQINQYYFSYLKPGTKTLTDFFSLGSLDLVFGYFGLIFGSRLIMSKLTYSGLLGGGQWMVSSSVYHDMATHEHDGIVS
jgi:hypothetical protein